jgi:hypothetical protein
MSVRARKCVYVRARVYYSAFNTAERERERERTAEEFIFRAKRLPFHSDKATRVAYEIKRM